MHAERILDGRRPRVQVRPPDHFATRPYLQPVCDEPEYVVRNVWRLNAGWWDGVASHLKPAEEDARGREIAGLAGGIEHLVERARALADAGALALPSLLIDWAVAAQPDRRPAHALRAAIYGPRVGRPPRPPSQAG